MNFGSWTLQNWLSSKDFNQPCADTEYSLEDRPRGMDDKNGWRQRKYLIPAQFDDDDEDDDDDARSKETYDNKTIWQSSNNLVKVFKKSYQH